MNQKNLYKQFLRLNKELFKHGENPLKCHGPDHHERVCKNALWLAKFVEKRDQRVNYEILIPACFLHDITAYNSHKSEKDHWNHQDDVRAATKVLKKLKYLKNKIDKIIQTISVHSTNTKHIDKNEPIEATLLRDADKMDVFGPLGITRILMAMSRRYYSIPEIIEIYHKQQNIKLRYQMMKIPEAKRKIKKDYQYSLNFFKKLKKQLE
jgi:HD superfamily phosphodiesterase